MKIAPSSAATNRSGWNTCEKPAQAVPTSTGATAAGSVRGRAAISQIRTPPGIAAADALTGAHLRRCALCPPRKLREVGRTPLEIGVAALLGLLAHVEEEVGVVGELLDAGPPVLVGVEGLFGH